MSFGAVLPVRDISKSSRFYQKAPTLVVRDVDKV